MQETLTFSSSRELFRYIKSLCDKSHSGELVLYNGEASSKIYLAAGQITWAFASGQPESFQSILLKEKLATKDSLVQGIRSSREKGMTSLEHILVEVGLDDIDARRGIIERHSRSALETIGEWGRCVGKLIEKEPTAEDDNTIAFGELVPDIDKFCGAPQKAVAIRKEVAPVKDLNEVLNRLREEVPYFLGAMIIDGQTGMPVLSLADLEELDVEVVSAYYRDLLKSAQDAQEALGSVYGEQEKSVEEILVTTENDYVLLQVLAEGKYLLYVLLDKTSNPGMARVILRRYLDAINSFL
jgi:predicted regulator of Ras-like GTPase activity (Roadblock/LC7/MglB family)